MPIEELATMFFATLKEALVLVLFVAGILAFRYVKNMAYSFCKKNNIVIDNDILNKISLITDSTVKFVSQTFTDKCRKENGGELTDEQKSAAFNMVKTMLDAVIDENDSYKHVLEETYGDIDNAKTILIESAVKNNSEPKNAGLCVLPLEQNTAQDQSEPIIALLKNDERVSTYDSTYTTNAVHLNDKGHEDAEETFESTK